MEQAATKPAPKRTGLYIGIVVVVVIALAGVAFGASRIVAGQQAAATATAQYAHDYGACGVVVAGEAIIGLDGLYDRFFDVYDVASATGRGALAPVVRDMQDIGQEIQALPVPVCLALAKGDLAGGVSASVDGFLAFMAQSSDSTVGGHFDTAAALLQDYKADIERVQACMSDC